MLFAGAIDVPAEVVFAILAAFLLMGLALSLTGGALAWSMCRRRSAIPLGTVVFAATGLLCADALHLWGSLTVAYLASAITGLLLRTEAVPQD